MVFCARMDRTSRRLVSMISLPGHVSAYLLAVAAAVAAPAAARAEVVVTSSPAVPGGC